MRPKQDYRYVYCHSQKNWKVTTCSQCLSNIPADFSDSVHEQEMSIFQLSRFPTSPNVEKILSRPAVDATAVSS